MKILNRTLIWVATALTATLLTQKSLALEFDDSCTQDVADSGVIPHESMSLQALDIGRGGSCQSLDGLKYTKSSIDAVSSAIQVFCASSTGLWFKVAIPLVAGVQSIADQIIDQKIQLDQADCANQSATTQKVVDHLQTQGVTPGADVTQ